MKSFLFTLTLAGLVAGQSAPPRKDIPAIAKAANGVIVSIITSDKDGKPVAQGTGFLVSKDGRIVTNYHVIKNASSAIVKLPDGAFYDVDGVVTFDKVRDLAVIKAHGEKFRVVTLGDSDRVQVGEEIVSIGSPLSLESTVSSGIVSGIRTIEEKGGKFLQVTAPISPGSSGGPLFNMAGEVVGITTLYLEGGENLNFAIPINDAKRLLSADSKVQEFAVELEKDISTKVWRHPGSTNPEKTKVWIEKDHLYESSEPWSFPNQENLAYSVSCDTVQGATLLPKLGPSGLYTGECTYTYKWIKESVTCTVKTVETITRVSPNAILGWSQHVDMSPLRHTPPTCPIAGIDGATFALEPIEPGNTPSSVASPPVQPLPNEPEPAQAQTLDATKALSWISSHMLGKALHTMPGTSGSTMQMWESSSLSFQGCRVTIYDETIMFTVFRSGETYPNGTSTVTWGPFDLSNLRPDEISRAPDNIFQPPGAFLQIGAVSAIPVVQTNVPDSTISAMRSALHIWFDSADLVDRQAKTWHDAIIACGGKPIPDVY